jgi:hypothetical protein
MIRLIIHAPDCDFTPFGKRRARVVTHDKGVQRIRWYVSGKRFRVLPVNGENIALTRLWLASVSTHPQARGHVCDA